MKQVKFIIPAVFFLFSIQQLVHAQDTRSENGLTWYNQMKDAHSAAQKSKKPIFAFFTGSDWCGWCHKLQRDVFAKKEFIDWAKKNVILLELDFPRYKKLPEDLSQQNNTLARDLNVSGFPTIWLLNAGTGKGEAQMGLAALGSLGYPSGAESGKEEVKFLATANEILAKANTKTK